MAEYTFADIIINPDDPRVETGEIDYSKCIVEVE